MPTALDRNSKHDSVLMLDSVGGLSVDISQERDNLTNNTTYLREASSARTAITTPREISLRFTAKSGDSGIIVNHGTNDGVSSTFRVDVTSGALRCLENGSVRVQATLPSLAVGDRSYAAQWSTRPEGSSVRSELIVQCLTTGTYAHGFGTHAVGTTNTGWNLQIAGYGNAPTSAYDIADIKGVRIGKRFHSQVEFVEDWVAESTKPDLLGRVRDAALPIVSDIGIEGEFAGLAYLHAGATARDVDRRLVSPLVNVRMPSEFLIAKADYTDTGSRRLYRPAPGDPQYYLAAQHWWYVPVPRHMNKGRVRAFIRMFTVDEGPCSMIFKALSWANFPFAGEPAKAPVIYSTGGVFLSEDHASGGGEWVDLGNLHLARDDLGCTSICIAHSFEFGADSEAVDDTRFALMAVTVEPFYLPDDPGFDIGF